MQNPFQKKSLELPFQVNANWSLKFFFVLLLLFFLLGVILTFAAAAVIGPHFAFLARITSVSVEPSELAVN